MITGVHAIIFTTDAKGDRAFFQDVLEFPSVDAGGGWRRCHVASRLSTHHLLSLPTTECWFLPHE
jgi:hypothetical protein